MNMKKSGLLMLACVLMLASGSLLQAKVGGKTKIYTIFNSRLVTGKAYSIYHPNVEIIEDKEVLEILKEKCKEVEFVGETRLTKEAIKNIKSQKENIDGILCLGGTLPDELTSIGLPVIAVFRLWGQWFPLYPSTAAFFLMSPT